MGHTPNCVSREEFIEKIDAIEVHMEANSKKLDDIEGMLDKYRGFVGGVLFVLGLIWAGITFLRDLILKALGV